MTEPSLAEAVETRFPDALIDPIKKRFGIHYPESQSNQLKSRLQRMLNGDIHTIDKQSLNRVHLGGRPIRDRHHMPALNIEDTTQPKVEIARRIDRLRIRIHDPATIFDRQRNRRTRHPTTTRLHPINLRVATFGWRHLHSALPLSPNRNKVQRLIDPSDYYLRSPHQELSAIHRRVAFAKCFVAQRFCISES